MKYSSNDYYGFFRGTSAYIPNNAQKGTYILLQNLVYFEDPSFVSLSSLGPLLKHRTSGVDHVIPYTVNVSMSFENLFGILTFVQLIILPLFY